MAQRVFATKFASMSCDQPAARPGASRYLRPPRSDVAKLLRVEMADCYYSSSLIATRAISPPANCDELSNQGGAAVLEAYPRMPSANDQHAPACRGRLESKVRRLAGVHCRKRASWLAFPPRSYRRTVRDVPKRRVLTARL